MSRRVGRPRQAGVRHLFLRPRATAGALRPSASLFERWGCGRVSTDTPWRSVVPRPFALLVAIGLAAVVAGAPRPKGADAPVYMPTAAGTKWVYDQNGQELVEEVTGAVSKDGETVLTVQLKMTGQAEY